MKKPFIIFIIFSILIILATNYCNSKPEGCKKVDSKDRGVNGEGIDW